MERSVDRTPWDDDCPLSLSLHSLCPSYLSCLSAFVSPLPSPPSFPPSFSFLHGFILYSAWRKRDAGVAEPRTADFLRPRSPTPRSSPGISSKMVFKLNSFLLENIDLCFGNYAETGIRYFEYIPSYIPSYTVS